MMVVIMCVSCQLSTLLIFTKHYQRRAPYQNHHQIRVRRRLPNVTKIFARGAKPCGILGLVYQRLPTCRSGWDPATGCLYQAPPPGDKDGYDTLLWCVRCIGCGGLLDYPNWLCTWHRQGCDGLVWVGLRLGRIHIDWHAVALVWTVTWVWDCLRCIVWRLWALVWLIACVQLLVMLYSIASIGYTSMWVQV